MFLKAAYNKARPAYLSKVLTTSQKRSFTPVTEL